MSISARTHGRLREHKALHQAVRLAASVVVAAIFIVSSGLAGPCLTRSVVFTCFFREAIPRPRTMRRSMPSNSNAHPPTTVYRTPFRHIRSKHRLYPQNTPPRSTSPSPHSNRQVPVRTRPLHLLPRRSPLELDRRGSGARLRLAPHPG